METLTRREVVILQIRADSGSVKQTAHKLGVQPQTVKNQLNRIHKKLNARSTIECIGIAYHRGWIT